MMLAAELALAGVDVAIVERRASRSWRARAQAGCTPARSRSSTSAASPTGSSPRGRWSGRGVRRRPPLDVSDFPTRHPYALGLWQNHIERILAGWVDELAVPVHRGREVTGFAQDDAGVDVELADGGSLRARYLVGCDGGRSVVRKAAGIEFPGWDPTTSSLIAEVEMAEEPELGTRQDARGVHGLGRVEYEIRDGEVVYADRGPVRVMVTEPHARAARASPPCAISARRSSAVCGTDYGIHSPTWISRFTDTTRQAAAYRDGRVLLAGDAAHVHSPVGRAGDQHRRAGRGEPRLEARPGGQRAPRRTASWTPTTPSATRSLPACCATRWRRSALQRRRPRIEALRDAVAELLGMDEPRRQFAGMHVRPGHPLRPRRGTPAARAPHARPRPGHRRRPAAGLHPAARRPAGAAQPR